MSFVQLHIHSSLGSHLDGIGTSEEYAKIAKEKGHPALAITDHGKMNAFFEHQKACLKHGIKPIFGVEAYVETQLIRLDPDTNKRVRCKNMHLTLLAKNKIGYKNLLKLNYISNTDSHFYYRNHMLVDEIFENKEGLVVGSGCMNNPFSRLFREDKKEESEKLFKRFSDEFGDDFYVEVQINELTDTSKNRLEKGQQEINEWMIYLAKKYNKLIVLTGDVHYPEKGQDILQTIGIAMKNGEQLESMTWEIESKSLFYHDENDYQEFNELWDYGYKKEEITEWCNNSGRIAEKCNYLIPERMRMVLPTLYEDDDEVIIEKAKKGLERIFKCKYEDAPEEYRNRLEYEIGVIVRKGMSSYCLILEDIFSFVREEKIIRAPARGSGGGSLLLYCLDITTLDPIKYGLIFERFLSQSRAPDVVYDYFGELENS